MPAVPPLAQASFVALAVAMLTLWAPRWVASADDAAHWWTAPFAFALVIGVASRVVDAGGLVAILFFGAACWAARRAAGTFVTLATHAAMLALCAGLLLHAIPGFDNPLVLRDVVISPGSAPYTKYLNFDKGVAGLFLLGVYAPGLPRSDEGQAHLTGFLWRFVIIAAGVLLLTLAVGYVQWDAKLPSWWPIWLGSMVFLTALPEEAIFRGVVQTAIRRRMGETRSAGIIAMVLAGTLFGVAHLGGGWLYVLLATAAGIGYGWIYGATRSIGASIVAHTALNTVHFLFFTYPSLAAGR